MDLGICGKKLIVVDDNDWQAFSEAAIREADKNEDTPPSYYAYYNWDKIAKKVVDQL
jgi:hypothetical protein